MRTCMSMTALAAALISTAAPAWAQTSSYTEADFATVRKFDAHVHANVVNPLFLEIAEQDRFELLSINVDYPDFPPLELQADAAHQMQAADPVRFHFTTTMAVDGFGAPGWDEKTIAAIAQEVAKGAVGVKVWKNIGMGATDASGKRIFLDDPRFNDVVRYLEKHDIPLIAHQGEPRNAWLPLDEMTTDNDRRYFESHPEYHMYLHPEEPSYEELMARRDLFVALHPDLGFDGAHMASLEWSVDELTRFFDRYPNTVADLAARMSNLQVQSQADREKVRNFFIKYQDRILYGTDLTDSAPQPGARAQNPPMTSDFAREADRVWRSDWRYLATPRSQHIAALNAEVAGLDLPREVIDKIYWTNAQQFFALEQTAP